VIAAGWKLRAPTSGEESSGRRARIPEGAAVSATSPPAGVVSPCLRADARNNAGRRRDDENDKSPAQTCPRVRSRQGGMAMNPGKLGLAIGVTFVAVGALATAQVTELVSVDSNGVQGNGLSIGSCVSFDGRFVVFESEATNFVASDTNGERDVFVHDRKTGTTERVSVDSLGNEALGGRSQVDLMTGISADGRFVTFTSWASNLAPGVDTNGWTSDVFVHDRLTGTTEAVDVTVSGICAANGASTGSISGDGRYVAFTGYANDLIPGGTSGRPQVYVRDLLTGTNELVSADSSGNEGNDYANGAYISMDGHFVAFTSLATNFVAGDTNGVADTFIKDRWTGAVEMIDVDAAGIAGDLGANVGPVSADGRYVTFVSNSPSLIGAGPGTQSYQVFVRDRQTATNTIVSVDSSGVLGNDESAFPSISADGRFVAFQSKANNVVWDDTNYQNDAFVHDMLTGTTSRWDVRPDGGESSAPGTRWVAFAPSISGNGRFLAFTGFGSDLVGGDTNGFWDVFVRSSFTLEADPPQVTAGATLTFTTWTGDASKLALLVLIDVDGAPMFLPAAISAFDAEGVWSFSATVPSGLSGSVWTFRSYGFVPTGKVQASNDVAVTFQ
jgi:Tol biopolymer transport system component